ncbi:hypothetical protein BC829DRAFT_391759 [Chytridium lagenaria]|nr:hypothetical protein BC829DRAFT_391759 [Chytridium lagenaria]
MSVGGLQWSSLVGCFLIFYCFTFSQRYFAHGLSGFIGTLVETAYIAARRECVPPSPTTASAVLNSSPLLAYLLLFNEINWIVHEATTVYYSFIKTSVIFTSDILRRTFTIIMAILLVIFAALRVNIGRLRFSNNALGNPAIASAHSYAFLVWGIADLIILFLLVWNVYDHVTKRTSSNTESKGMIMTLMNSSIPRISIIFFNILASDCRGRSTPFPVLKTLANFNSFLWLVKGSFPMILLLDILMTKNMLIASHILLHKQTANSMLGNNGNSRKKHEDEESGVGSSSVDHSTQIKSTK